MEESVKLPFMVTLTAKQEFAQKSEKPLCLAATTAMWELVVRSEKLEIATISWEKRRLWSCHNLLRIKAFFLCLPNLPLSTSHWQTLTQNHKGRGFWELFLASPRQSRNGIKWVVVIQSWQPIQHSWKTFDFERSNGKSNWLNKGNLLSRLSLETWIAVGRNYLVVQGMWPGPGILSKSW